MAISMNFFFGLYDAGIMRIDYSCLPREFGGMDAHVLLPVRVIRRSLSA
jgi:hypothetical protein